MTSQSSPPASWPRRDAEGRIREFMEFMAFVLLSLVIGVVMLLVIDGVLALLSFGVFGGISGWICGLLAAFVFVEDFRAWRSSEPVWARWTTFAVAALLGLVVSMGLLSLLPVWWMPLFNGALAVTVGCLFYVTLWYFGIRVLTGERP